MRAENFSFAEIAKKVGERWQVLPPEEKEPFETQAGSAKEKYLAELAEYKKTDEYREYTQYLADFKSRNNVNTGTGFYLKAFLALSPLLHSVA